jgi:hypothetical protein
VIRQRALAIRLEDNSLCPNCKSGDGILVYSVNLEHPLTCETCLSARPELWASYIARKDAASQKFKERMIGDIEDFKVSLARWKAERGSA